MRALRAAVVALLIAGLALYVAVMAGNITPTPVRGYVVPTSYRLVPPVRVDRCTEDMDCWDCRVMGNRQCGKP